MSNRSVQYTIGLNNNVIASLQQTEAAALRLDNVMHGINSTMQTIGIGLGAHALKNIAEDWIQGAADIENAFQRIQNISKDAIDGLRNVSFINAEVDKFKIPLQEATDAYGKFLAMVRGSGLAANDVRKLHDEVLLIGKVAHIDNGQMDAAVRNLGKMLEVGSLDARHFFFLEQQLSGIGAYVAKNLDVSLHELAKMRHEGDLTGLDAKILLKSIDDMAQDLGGKLPESLQTTQSAINELSNEWVRFKNDFVLDNKDDLIGFFDNLRDGIGFLKENSSEIYNYGSSLLAVIALMKGYQLTRAAMLAVDSLFLANIGGQISANTLLAQQENARMLKAKLIDNALLEQIQIRSELAHISMLAHEHEIDFLSIEGQEWARLNALIMEANVSMSTFADTTLALNGASAAAMATNSASVAGKGFIGGMAGTVSNAVTAVAVVWMAAEIIEGFGGFGKKQSGESLSWKDFVGGTAWSESHEGVYKRLEQNAMIPYSGMMGKYSSSVWSKEERDKEDYIRDQMAKHPLGLFFDKSGNIQPQAGTDVASKLNEINRISGIGGLSILGLKQKNDPNEPSAFDSKITTPPKLGKSSGIRGNSVTNIDIIINGGVNGMVNPKFSVKNMEDMAKIQDVVGVSVAKILTQAVNDSQIVAGRK